MLQATKKELRIQKIKHHNKKENIFTRTSTSTWVAKMASYRAQLGIKQEGGKTSSSLVRRKEHNVRNR